MHGKYRDDRKDLIDLNSIVSFFEAQNKQVNYNFKWKSVKFVRDDDAVTAAGTKYSYVGTVNKMG